MNKRNENLPCMAFVDICSSPRLPVLAPRIASSKLVHTYIPYLGKDHCLLGTNTVNGHVQWMVTMVQQDKELITTCYHIVEL